MVEQLGEWTKVPKVTSGIGFRVVRGRDLERVCLLEDASVALLRPVGIYKAPGLPRFSFASLSLLFSHLSHLSHRPALLNDLMKPACFIVILQPCIALRRISGNNASSYHCDPIATRLLHLQIPPGRGVAYVL